MSKRGTKSYSIEIPSMLSELPTVEELAETVADEAGLTGEDKDNLAIAVTEAVINAIIHGNKKEESKKVYIDFDVSKKKIKISVRDEGNGFDPDKLSDPLAPENILKESGRGIFILRSLMDKVDFLFSSLGTKVIMTKKI